MADTAAYLASQVFPANVPVRQWVLSLPKALRARLGYDAALLSSVVSIFVGALRRHLTHRAKSELGLRRVGEAHVGVVTAIQRFGSAAELNVHLHSLVCDGVFVEESSGVRFRELAAPSTDEIAVVSAHVCRRVVAMLSKRGLWRDDALVDDEEEPSIVAHLGAASVQGTLVFAQGRRPIRLLGAAARTVAPGLKGYAFDVDAAVRVHDADRARLERLCRYILRPPIANDRLVKRSDGRFELRLKRAWSDGTTHLVFDGPEFIARLAALVPPPRIHQVRYHGVFAPRAKLRPMLVRAVVADSHEAHGCAEAHASAKRVHLPWEKLLARVFAVDVLACPRCVGGRLQRIAFITTTHAIRAILASVGLSTGPVAPVQARRTISSSTGCKSLKAWTMTHPSLANVCPAASIVARVDQPGTGKAPFTPRQPHQTRPPVCRRLPVSQGLPNNSPLEFPILTANMSQPSIGSCARRGFDCTDDSELLKLYTN